MSEPPKRNQKTCLWFLGGGERTRFFADCIFSKMFGSDWRKIWTENRVSKITDFYCGSSKNRCFYFLIPWHLFVGLLFGLLKNSLNRIKETQYVLKLEDFQKVAHNGPRGRPHLAAEVVLHLLKKCPHCWKNVTYICLPGSSLYGISFEMWRRARPYAVQKSTNITLKKVPTFPSKG